MEQTVLAVDIGTSSLKAALIDARGTVVRSSRCRFPKSDRVPADWVNAFNEAVADLSPDRGLAAIAVSGNGPTLVSVSERDEASALLLWNDPIPGADGHTVGAPATPSIFIPRIRAFRRVFPDEFQEARWIISGPEYLIKVLTGEAITILPERRYADAYWTDASLAAADIDPAILPPFAFPGSVVGTCCVRGMQGIPVIAGGADFFVGLAGTGAIEPGIACDRAGTSEGLNLCTREPVSHPAIRTLPSLLGEYWNASYLLPETGARFHAWRRESGQLRLSYPEIMARIEASPLVPPPGMRPHPGREIVEEIGFCVRRGMETIREATGFAGEYRLSGGQARNDIWNQMKADITGSTLALTATADGELMGDAILGFMGLGVYASALDASKAMVRVDRRFVPDPALSAQYARRYASWKGKHHEDLLDSRRP